MERVLKDRFYFCSDHPRWIFSNVYHDFRPQQSSVNIADIPVLSDKDLSTLRDEEL